MEQVDMTQDQEDSFLSGVTVGRTGCLKRFKIPLCTWVNQAVTQYGQGGVGSDLAGHIYTEVLLTLTCLVYKWYHCGFLMRFYSGIWLECGV